MSLIKQIRALRLAEADSSLVMQPSDPILGGPVGPDLSLVAALEAEVRELLATASDHDLLLAYASSAGSPDKLETETVLAELTKRGIEPSP